jgi:hypothetical protein
MATWKDTANTVWKNTSNTNWKSSIVIVTSVASRIWLRRRRRQIK